jgi:hypothetical protein
LENKYIHGTITKKHPMWLPLSQTRKNVIFFLFSFFFYKIGDQEGGTGPAEGGEVSIGRGEMAGKGDKKMNTTQKIYTHVCKCKNDTY